MWKTSKDGKWTMFYTDIKALSVLRFPTRKDARECARDSKDLFGRVVRIRKVVK